MLAKIDPRGPSKWDKEQVKRNNVEMIREIGELQRVLYAQARHSLLIVLQGVDASGKDGTVRTIFEGVNPLGCRVHGFRKPTDREAAQDFLWRVHQEAPRRGMIKIFNRSHYEDILVPAVEGLLPESKIDERYEHINAFERLLAHNDTHVLKFYLHVSRKEQLERLTERLNNREKFWKHNDGDWDTREKWDAYMKVYETIFERCNEVPWQIVPADRNWVKVRYVAEALLDKLKSLDLAWPDLETDRF